MRDRAKVRAEVAAMLDRLAAETGDRRFSHAAAIIGGRKSGRRPVDDGEAVAAAETWFRAGLAPSKNAACRRAAEYYAPPHQVDATRARYMRKLRTKLIKSNDAW